jgi:hypothetical protein
VNLVNTTDETVAMELEDHPFGTVIDLVTGRPVPNGPETSGIAGTSGPTLPLRPGRPVSLAAVDCR